MLNSPPSHGDSQPPQDGDLRKLVLSMSARVSHGCPSPLGDADPAAILGDYYLQGDVHPCTPSDCHPAIFRHCS